MYELCPSNWSKPNNINSLSTKSTMGRPNKSSLFATYSGGNWLFNLAICCSVASFLRSFCLYFSVNIVAFIDRNQ